MDAWAAGFSLQWMSLRTSSVFGQGNGTPLLIIAMAGWLISLPEIKESFAHGRNGGIGLGIMNMVKDDQTIYLHFKISKT